MKTPSTNELPNYSYLVSSGHLTRRVVCCCWQLVRFELTLGKVSVDLVDDQADFDQVQLEFSGASKITSGTGVWQDKARQL